MCARSRLGIVVVSVESIILVWNYLNSQKNYMWIMANQLVVKYVTFHSVLKELIVTYSINSKRMTTNFLRWVILHMVEQNRG
jgi:hypothetical protein